MNDRGCAAQVTRRLSSRWFSFLPALLHVAVLILLWDGGLAVLAAAKPGSDMPPLPALVREFLDAEEAAQAEALLARILKDPQATVGTVQALLQNSRAFGDEPVGLQRSLPVQVESHTYRFGLYVPASYRPTHDYGLVVCLHGAGFTGDAYLERWQARLGEEFLLACPTLLQGNWWTRTAEQLVLATIRTVMDRYRVDPDRVILTGMSNGGIGSLLIGIHHAPLFAGISPMAGGIDDVLFPFLENFRNTPLYLIHGLQDQVMPVELSRDIAKELTRLKYPFIYREHDHVHPLAGGHFFPREELPALVRWFGTLRRDPLPKHLTVVRDASHLTPFSWVRIDATDRIAAFSELLMDSRDETLANRVYARLSADIVGPNRIEVRTQRVRRYSLFLNQRLVDLTQPVTVLTNGRVSYEGPVVPSLDTLLREGRRRQDPMMLFPVRVTIVVEPDP